MEKKTVGSIFVSTFERRGIRCVPVKDAQDYKI